MNIFTFIRDPDKEFTVARLVFRDVRHNIHTHVTLYHLQTRIAVCFM